MSEGASNWISIGEASRPRHKRTISMRMWRILWHLILPPQGHRTTPTMTGFILILVSIGLGTAAYNEGGGGGNILFMALSLLLSSIVLSGLLSMINFQKLQWRLHIPSEIRAGEVADIGIALRNNKRLMPTYGISIEMSGEDAVSTNLHLSQGIRPKGEQELNWSYLAKSRGRHTIRVKGLISSYPFGFLKKRISENSETTVIVLPKRIDYEFNPSLLNRVRQQGSNLRRPGIGEHLYNIRRYQPGDHQRMVHWKATARLKRMMVKQVMEESQNGYTLLIATQKALWGRSEQLETLISFAASLAEDLFQARRLIGVQINNDPLRPVTRLSELRQVLEALALLECCHVPVASQIGVNTIAFSPGGKEGVHARINGENFGYAR